ncbi:hypothetical protein [Methylobacterium sp. A54F]
MKKPTKSKPEAGTTHAGGALGNIDELTGHPGKGTPGPTMKPEHNPDPDKGVAPKKPRG